MVTRISGVGGMAVVAAVLEKVVAGVVVAGAGDTGAIVKDNANAHNQTQYTQ